MSLKVLIGPNGSGKSRYVSGLRGNLRYLTFRDSYGASDAGYYLQQRWNSSEYDEVPLVRDSLGACNQSDFQRAIFDAFGIDELLDKPLILLSSGELRKFQLVKAVLARPRLLVIDSPYIGLDRAARGQVSSLIKFLSSGQDMDIILVLSREEDIPDYADEIVRFDSDVAPSSDLQSAVERVSAMPGIENDGCDVVKLNKVSIRFDERAILKDLDWTVRRGEKWALEGPNGAGKSTLLSIICADIPQAYACDVTLFGRRRGTGETIWDIKRHIGFVSPELHRAYCRNVSVIDVVASGLHDRQGMYVATDASQVPDCEFWLDVFGIRHLKDCIFTQISSGEQRLALLARAFVKDPELLILDEPLHGLDNANRGRVKSVIDAFCARSGKTLIMVSHYEEDFPACITDRLVLQKH